MAEVAGHWEKRARELMRNGWAGPEIVEDMHTKAALQLGREMAAEAHRAEVADCAKIMGEKESAWRAALAKAADARAEEIADKLNKWAHDSVGDKPKPPAHTFQAAAGIARSTISKPESFFQSLENDLWKPPTSAESEAAIRADEREKIADMIQGAARGHSTPHWLEACDHFARLLRKPKTREAALEDALREIASKCEREPSGLYDPNVKRSDISAIARRALEWKPK